MASLILSTAGNSLFGPVGGFIGALAGTAIDNAAITALTPARVQPSRLAGLKVQSSEEGAPMPIVYGRFRVTGQVIWTSRFREINTKRTIGGKGGQRVVERSYTISFAIGLCEGPIDGLGKVWVNGTLADLATMSHRIYLGNETQMPDPLIEAVEGLNNAPAFRGLAYIVFEDFPVTPHGDRIPQFAFEVLSSPQTGSGEDIKKLVTGVCLIPGAGEFAYATTLIRKVLGPGDETGENLHASAQRSDFQVSLDNLSRDFPYVNSISLVVAWFGTDLRAGQCQIVPKVEDATKQTKPRAWSVAGLTRANAQLVSQSGGKPAYGGSPDDQSVIEAILSLKSRGHRVTHNPFIMMDIPSGNNLPNPLGGTSQPPYPWRGRITCFPGIGQPSSVDGTTNATSQINAFFGTATASHFNVAGGKVTYSGPNEWSYRRFVLHQAALTVAAGGVDSFLIGSELIGLTRVRGMGNSFPTVTALIALANEVRILVGPNVTISYGADWTEYGAYVPPSTNDLRFPLDPLWANSNIDFIGLDWYAPLTDRRDGEPRASLTALQNGVESGEGYDFYYANDADRLAKSRTPITDGTYQEPWVWRQKDMRNFWANAHYERVNGVRAINPTAWVPKSKPLALMELGFPAVDKGANRPSVFPDPKSSESGLPPFSNGARDDVEQRLALEATLSYWRDNNPSSPLYQGAMLDLSRSHIWAWDGRPYPYFPGLTDVWADGTYAMLGHWLAGRAGAVSLAALISDIAGRSGLVDLNLDGVSGYVEGFAIETPTSARSVLENLFAVFGLEAVSRASGLSISDAKSPLASAILSTADLLLDHAIPSAARANQAFAGPSAGRFSCYAAERDYLPTSYTSPATGQSGSVSALASSLVLEPAWRQAIANRLARIPANDSLSLRVSPAMSARLEAGDRVALSDGAVWRVDRSEGAWSQNLSASRAADALPLLRSESTVPQVVLPTLYSSPVLVVLDVPAPFASSTQPRPLVGCAAAVWPGPIDVSVGGQVLGSITKAATIGNLVAAIAAGPVARLMQVPLMVTIKFGATLPANGAAALLEGGVVKDIISWRKVDLVGPGQWQLSGWVRGLNGSSDAPVIGAGAEFIMLDEALVDMPLNPSLVGTTLEWQAQPNIDTSLITKRSVVFSAKAKQPWAPCGLKAKRTANGVTFTWVRRARGTGDAWSSANAPLGANLERYSLRLLTSVGAVVRTFNTNGPIATYTNAQELADFGTTQTSFRVTLVQVGDDDIQGMPLAAVVGV